MKTALIILLTLSLSNSLFATELEWVDEQVEAIKPPRKGVNIASIATPFVFLEKNRSKDKKDAKKTSTSSKKSTPSKAVDAPKVEQKAPVKKSFTLSTIINSSAMIDGNWYKVNDKLRSYTVTDITKTTVTLEDGTKKLTLSTIKRNQNLKFKNK
ncbi:MAG: hypothetical protein WCY51_02545 [Sulfurimonas sp.]|uniref:hypothetical protein n=1 Tax=Sulfurimonas sp. TaxID=2022749 RepID=UPI0025F8F557|nr:hypothetical protein [Sulfurimonas sp.]MCK9454818.1 hypothetical protein [Sulfurimonas sp.]